MCRSIVDYLYAPDLIIITVAVSVRCHIQRSKLLITCNTPVSNISRHKNTVTPKKPDRNYCITQLCSGSVTLNNLSPFPLETRKPRLLPNCPHKPQTQGRSVFHISIIPTFAHKFRQKKNNEKFHASIAQFQESRFKMSILGLDIDSNGIFTILSFNGGGCCFFFFLDSKVDLLAWEKGFDRRL